MTLEIPLQAVPAQSLKVVLDGQNVQLSIYQKPQGLFVDVDGMSLGVIARNLVPLVCRDYSGFAGNLIFMDTRGTSDPTYSELNTRFVLLYLTAAEYALF